MRLTNSQQRYNHIAIRQQSAYDFTDNIGSAVAKFSAIAFISQIWKVWRLSILRHINGHVPVAPNPGHAKKFGPKNTT
jgi:hypothetical protein